MKRKLNEEIINNIESEVILMLLNCIECEENKGGYMWNANNPYYAEAFGIYRGLSALGYTFFGATNTPTVKENARWWFSECQSKAEKIKNEIGIKEALKIYNQKCSEISNRSKVGRAF